MIRKALNNAFGLVLITLFLISCGSSGGVDSRPATFNDLVGSWKLTDTDGDEVIFIFENNGDINIYDYMGDSFDQGPDCYIGPIFAFTIADLGDGEFMLDGDSSSTVSGTISGNTLVLTDSIDPLIIVRDNITVTELSENICNF